jgi:hypothetical protein
MRNAILGAEFLSKVGFSRAWGSSDKNLQREEASEVIEFIVEHLH